MKESTESKNTLLELFQQTVDLYPNITAVQWNKNTFFENQGKIEEPDQLTFAELNAYSNQWAHYFSKVHKIELSNTLNQDAIDEPIIAIHLERSNPTWVVICFGLWKAGAAALLLDSTLSSQDIQYRITNAKPRYIITHTLLTLNNCSESKILLLRDIVSIIKTYPKTDLIIKIHPKALAYIAYTSGSTGQSKAFAINHTGIVPIIQKAADYLEAKPGDKIAQLCKFNFDACYMEFLFLIKGITLVLFNRTSMSSEHLESFLNFHKITLAILVPSIMATLNSQNLPHLRAILSTGEHASKALFDRWRNQSQRIIINGYGPGEVTIGTSMEHYQGDGIFLGLPIPGIRLFLLDLDEKCKRIEKGIIGEIALAGEALARGYVRDGKLSHEMNEESFVFINDPDFPQQSLRVYLTGDLAIYEGEKLIFKGRKDRQIKIRGTRIELVTLEGKVRNIVSELDDRINTVHIVPLYAKEDEESLSTISHLCAFLVCKQFYNDTALTIAEIYQKLKEKGLLENIDFVFPTQWYFLTENIIGIKDYKLLNSSYKFNIKQLQHLIKEDEQFKQQLISLQQTASISNLISLKTINYHPIEKYMCSLWADILNSKNIQLSDELMSLTFVEIGGHSMDQSNLLEQINKTFQVNLTYTQIRFHILTFEALCIEVVRYKLYQIAWEYLNKAQGKKTVFVCHPVSGDCSEFKKNKLGIEDRLIGLKSPALIYIKDNNDKYLIDSIKYYKQKAFCHNITEIAHYALYGLQQIQSKGPFYLIGYSYGSQLAYEMACQLQARYQQVAYLGIFDGAAPGIIFKSLEQNNEGIHHLHFVTSMIANIFGLKMPEIAINKIDLKWLPNKKIEVYFLQFFETLNKLLQENEILKPKTAQILNVFWTVQHNTLAMLSYTPSNNYNNNNNSCFIYTTRITEKSDSNLFATTASWEKYCSNADIRSITDKEHIELLSSEQMRTFVAEDLEAASSREKIAFVIKKIRASYRKYIK